MDFNIVFFFLLLFASFGLSAGLYYLVSPFKRNSATEFVNRNKLLFFFCIIISIIIAAICIYLITEVEGTDYIVLALSILMILDSCFLFDLAVRRLRQKTSSLGFVILFYLFGVAGFFFLYSVLAFWGY